MADTVTLFGIRHHGPGCARTLRRALESLQPDCLLIEGPAGCEALLTHLADPGLQPPIALLSHSADDPQLAVFHPYAVFSPEWQAMQWGLGAGIPVQFIDVPPAITLAWQQQDKRAALVAESGVSDPPPSDPVSDQANADADDHAPADPLDWLATAAGYADGESWWNHMVEERGDGEGLFEAIAEAMTELRANAPQRLRGYEAREAVREAHMRLALREARKAGHQRIAVVCGAWHVPALADPGTATADKALLKGPEKLKSQTTWVPWTYRHLSRRSGYGAGITAPGWYEHLWRHDDSGSRVIGWFARVARLLREHGLDCSSAHLIEAARLADSMAALRQRVAPGLDELNEATQSVICHGNDLPMRLIADELMIGNAMGSVPSSVPTVPLQRDLEALQKRLRLKPEALSRKLDLDLRNDVDRQRSQLLHRLGLLNITWGRLATVGHGSRGTFHEVWDLAWEPSFEVELIVASRHGHTLLMAANASANEQARHASTLQALAQLVDRVLLADLADAVVFVAAELDARAATSGDPLALLDALPALANVYRYGNVRQTDVSQVAHLFDSMLLRASLGLALAVSELNDEPAEQARRTILAADHAVSLRQDELQTQAWQRALQTITRMESSAPLLRGLASRLLLDAGAADAVQAASHIELQLSMGSEPLPAAQWLDGFLNRNATVLLHSDVLWSLIDRWISELSHEHFVRVVPLLRRTFAQFEAADRRDLGLRVKQPAAALASATPTSTWNEPRACRALPTLSELFGLPHE
ncbi:DUF5682 family protein [Dyella silvatica]|uniref:DUF5682 family protein n=1 Tax=Dyella silvatica TaxID=2992128 RepID=UPI00225B0D0C|nr:DUF5682 family protein [Dyella silvatica]